MEETSFDDYIKPYMAQINKMFEEPSGQFMLASPDFSILEIALRNLKKSQNYKFVNVKNTRDESPDNKVFIIRLTCVSSMEYQSLLYFYFDLPLHHNCFVCILTNSSNAFNFFEKRVMSRFKNKVVFFPYYKSFKEEDNTAKPINRSTKVTDSPRKENYNSKEVINSPKRTAISPKITICSSLDSQNQLILLERYNLDRFSLPFVLELFEPLHISLIIMSFTNRLNITKVYDQFRLLIVDTPELKKASPTRVLQCALEILESEVVNCKGFPSINYNEFKEFVTRKCPLYLKILLSSANKLKK